MIEEDLKMTKERIVKKVQCPICEKVHDQHLWKSTEEQFAICPITDKMFTITLTTIDEENNK